MYGKCSKISNTFLFLISTKMLLARFHKMLVRIANSKNPDQTDLSLHCLSGVVWQTANFEILEHLKIQNLACSHNKVLSHISFRNFRDIVEDLTCTC